ncbi:uncharacterized protein P174DRAFT_506173 [Aspergillus novofumigatus IBT 16806]|uniref:Uncharacterized protein n=1 Tax=Aspergillus novofumigatus (strain IBT 16806) TaxID=1392255 RepID=A0A2I1C3P5_ASPN1|nr:uncharacterized protein P174DRAFT_506173 [Aspergillus novofumigatus IBT 16806]PKX92223.1 hypothetical protein P174DRAFT_506173 [Aspergillus novofumigatus IBT 16806]
MSSSGNAYAAEPAYPILAHTLLSSHTTTARIPEQPDEPEQSSIWKLRKDIEEAFEGPSSVFRCGRVIGFSKLKQRAQEDDDHDLIGQLPRCLLAKHLRNTPPSPQPKAFIIHPPTFDPFSPKQLLASLLASPATAPLTRNEAIALLDHVQLLPVFDFRAAVQAISQVAEALQSAPVSGGKSGEHERESQRTRTRTLLLIAGLDTLTEDIIRASNPVKGAAALTAALRTLTQLSRAHGSHLAVMLVNTRGLGPAPGFHAGVGGERQQGSRGDFRASVEDEGVYSMFHAETSTPLLPSLLMRTLDQGIDTHVLVSMVKEDCVIEIIKDRVGEGWEGGVFGTGTP